LEKIHPLLSVDNLSTGYSKKTVLEGVSLHVKEGERIAVVGRNGAGKSTLLLTLLGVVKAWSGISSTWERSPPMLLRGNGCAREWPWCPRGGISSPI